MTLFLAMNLILNTQFDAYLRCPFRMACPKRLGVAEPEIMSELGLVPENSSVGLGNGKIKRNAFQMYYISSYVLIYFFYNRPPPSILHSSSLTRTSLIHPTSDAHTNSGISEVFWTYFDDNFLTDFGRCIMKKAG